MIFGKAAAAPPEERAFMLSELVLQPLFLSAGYQSTARHLCESSGRRNGEKSEKTERFKADNEQRKEKKKKKKAAQKGIIHFHFKPPVLAVINRTGCLYRSQPIRGGENESPPTSASRYRWPAEQINLSSPLRVSPVPPFTPPSFQAAPAGLVGWGWGGSQPTNPAAAVEEDNL